LAISWIDEVIYGEGSNEIFGLKMVLW
jgi:hypothetical protein